MSTTPEQNQSSQPPGIALVPTAQAVAFAPGLYLFSVRVANPVEIPGAGGVKFPALLVAAGPGAMPGSIEFVGNPVAASVWLCNVGDSTVVKIGGAGATLLLNSVRLAGDARPFDIKVDRLDVQQIAETSPVAAPATPATPSLKVRIGAHLLREGEVEFVDVEWAGRIGSGAWIEAFSIMPLEVLSPSDIEYKGLAANGFETPWLSDGSLCGTKGVNIPLIGFAIRLKAQAAVNYECEYSAVFRSGGTAGPQRNGVPCRSKMANDPLDAIQLRIIKRSKPMAAPMSPATRAAVSAVAQRKPVKGPSFGKFREKDDAPAKTPAAKPGTKRK